MIDPLSRPFDVIVVGAGPAGSSAALMLARAGWRVGLVNSQSQRLNRRGETLPAASRSTLRALGVWSNFLDDGHAACPGTVSWWGADTPIEQDAVFDLSGHAWHVDRTRFDRMLVDAAVAAGVEAIEDTRVVDAQFRDNGNPQDRWRIDVLRAGRMHTCTAGVLIVATGRANPAMPTPIVRERLDRLVGLGVILSESAESTRVDRRIWIEASPSGWWYSAPMPDGQWTMTFFTDADQAPAREGRVALSLYWLKQLALAPNTEERLACLNVPREALSPTALWRSLHVMAADSYRKVPCHRRFWFAVGDSASAWDPLSGQGIEKALRSGLRAAGATDALLRAPNRGATVLSDHARHEDEQEQRYRHLYYSYYYGHVRRWPNAVFWQRRRAA